MEDLALENSERVEELEQVCARWGLGVYGPDRGGRVLGSRAAG